MSPMAKTLLRMITGVLAIYLVVAAVPVFQQAYQRVALTPVLSSTPVRSSAAMSPAAPEQAALIATATVDEPITTTTETVSKPIPTATTIVTDPIPTAASIISEPIPTTTEIVVEPIPTTTEIVVEPIPTTIVQVPTNMDGTGRTPSRSRYPAGLKMTPTLIS